MEVKIINTYNEVRKYLSRIKNNENKELSWEKEVINPFWHELCKYAPFDLSDRKPKPIDDIESLEIMCASLEKLDMKLIQKEFEKVVSILPNYDDDPITIVIFPGNPSNAMVNEKQNGVIGSSTFGNMFIEVNPLIEDYEKWIPYVFAHEYHHTVFGNYWFMMHSDELNHQFAESLIVDGEADSFALSLYPDLKPNWLFDMTEKEISDLWNNKYKDIVSDTDVDYVKYMFGDKELGIPWCGGYKIGYMIVQNYLKKKDKKILEIIEVNPKEIIDAIK